MHRPGRRQFLRAGAVATVAGLSGCLMGGPPTGGSGTGGSWDETYGDDDYTTSFWGLTATSDGGFLAAGSEGSADQSRDALLVKVDADGDEAWTETFGEEGWQWFNKAVETDDGYIAGGASSGSEGDVAMLVGVDEDGDEDWQERYEGELAITWTYDVAATDDGGVIVVGRTGESYSPPRRPWALKADDDGEEEWRETYLEDGIESGQFWGVTPTEGGHLLTGEAREDSGGDPVGYAVEIDQDGDDVWSETYDDGRLGRATIVDRDTYVISGREGRLDGGAGWLLATDSAGDERWSETYDKDDSATLTDVVALGDGGLLGGLLGGGGGYLAVGNSQEDTDDNNRTGWLVKVDEAGDLEEEVAWDDDGNSLISAIVEAGGSHVVAGHVDDDGWESDDEMSQGRLVRDSF